MPKLGDPNPFGAGDGKTDIAGVPITCGTISASPDRILPAVSTSPSSCCLVSEPDITGILRDARRPGLDTVMLIDISSDIPPDATVNSRSTLLPASSSG